MITKEQIADKVAGIVAEQLSIDPSSVTTASTLDALGLDSLDRVEMLMSIEEAFDLEISDEVALGYKTIGDIVDGLVQHLTAS